MIVYSSIRLVCGMYINNPRTLGLLAAGILKDQTSFCDTSKKKMMVEL